MRGYSLLEVLIAVTIVAVGVAALAQLVGFAVHANLRARDTTVAAVLAQQKIEELLPTTGGDLQAVHDSMLSHGSIATKYIRRLSGM